MKKGDRLWDVAKRFHTTVDHVMEMNELDQEEVKEGQRLLLVKELRWKNEQKNLFVPVDMHKIQISGYPIL